MRSSKFFMLCVVFSIIILSGCGATSGSNDYDNNFGIDGFQTRTFATGIGFSMFIDESNNLYAWGRNNYGQLGNGTTENSNQLVFVMDNVVSVSSQANSTVAIRKDGSLWGWGSNGFGQLGDGTTMNRYSPIHIMDDVVYVSINYANTVAIKGDGSLWIWGENKNGQVGNGTLENQYTPVRIMDNVKAASNFSVTTMAVCTDGILWGWGLVDFIKILDATHEDELPLELYPIHLMDDVSSVSVGFLYATAIKTDNSLWAWGLNFDGILGDNTTQHRRYPVHIANNVFSVSSGAARTLSIQNGILLAWGSNFKGGLADGTTITTPGIRTVMNNVIATLNGSYNSFALQPDGSLWGWGKFEYPLYGSDLVHGYNLLPVKIAENVMLPAITPSISDVWEDFLGDPTFPSADHPLIGVWVCEDDNSIRYIFRMTGEGQRDGIIMPAPIYIRMDASFTWRVYDSQVAIYLWFSDRTERTFTIEDDVLIMKGHPMPDSSYRFIRQ